MSENRGKYGEDGERQKGWKKKTGMEIGRTKGHKPF
jgi:hypothetical protein